MKRLKKITKGLIVALEILVSVIPTIIIALVLDIERRNRFLDIVAEWVEETMEGFGQRM